MNGASNGQMFVPYYLDNTYGANNPTYNTTQTKVENPLAKSTGLPDKRFKERTISGGTNMSRGAAGFILAVNAINWGLETYGNWSIVNDKELVEEQMGILKKQVVRDVNDAIEMGLIPQKYINVEDLGNIANVVLSGVNLTKNDEIYRIGIEIVKKVSKNYRPQIEVQDVTIGNPAGSVAPADVTKQSKKIVQPIIDTE
jgi:hypothetical protein